MYSRWSEMICVELRDLRKYETDINCCTSTEVKINNKAQSNCSLETSTNKPFVLRNIKITPSFWKWWLMMNAFLFKLFSKIIFWPLKLWPFHSINDLAIHKIVTRKATIFLSRFFLTSNYEIKGSVPTPAWNFHYYTETALLSIILSTIKQWHVQFRAPGVLHVFLLVIFDTYTSSTAGTTPEKFLYELRLHFHGITYCNDYMISYH